MELYKVMKEELKVGDYIICKGSKVKIGQILYQDFYPHPYNPERSYIDIEFRDTKGKYRHWKSDQDGGTIEYADPKCGNTEYADPKGAIMDKIKNSNILDALLIERGLTVGATFNYLKGKGYAEEVVYSVLIDYLKDQVLVKANNSYE